MIDASRWSRPAARIRTSVVRGAAARTIDGRGVHRFDDSTGQARLVAARRA